MKTPEEILDAKFVNGMTNNWKLETRIKILSAMKEYAELYHESEVKKLNLLDVSWQSEQLICPHCGKYKRMQGNGIMHQLCECGE